MRHTALQSNPAGITLPCWGMSTGMDTVLLCYDGSPTADHAIREASQLLAVRRAVVLHIYSWEWQDLISREDLDAIAADVVAAGVRVAVEAGFEATGEHRYHVGLWQAIVDRSEEIGACAVVLGTRGRTALHMALGSVAYGVAHHCSRPVLLVRPPAR